MKSEPMNLNEVATEDLVAMLRHVSVETGSLACLGCGHEHNCGTRGCALIREAADRLDASRAPTLTPPNEWVSVEERLPEGNGEYIVTACDEGCPAGEGIWYDTVVVFAEYYDGCWTWNDGTEYDLTDIVTHWMPLPAPPGKDNNVPTKAQNEPLTIEQLREMVGCWVWVIVTYQHEGKTFQCDGWALVETPARIAYLDQEFQLTELGTRFHAYRHQVSDFRVRVAPNDL